MPTDRFDPCERGEVQKRDHLSGCVSVRSPTETPRAIPLARSLFLNRRGSERLGDNWGSGWDYILYTNLMGIYVWGDIQKGLFSSLFICVSEEKCSQKRQRAKHVTQSNGWKTGRFLRFSAKSRERDCRRESRHHTSSPNMCKYRERYFSPLCVVWSDALIE